MQQFKKKLKNTPRDASQVPCSVNSQLNKEETLSVESGLKNDKLFLNNPDGNQSGSNQKQNTSVSVYVLNKRGEPLMPCSPRKAKLKTSPNAIMIERSFPSTKLCLNCGALNILSLANRTYKCDCGYEEDRDIKAAKTILHAGRCKMKYVPMERREFKPVENKTSAPFDLSRVVSYNSVKQEAPSFMKG